MSGWGGGEACSGRSFYIEALGPRGSLYSKVSYQKSEVGRTGAGGGGGGGGPHTVRSNDLVWGGIPVWLSPIWSVPLWTD